MGNSSKSLWLVYDGDCPFCSAAARMYRIKQTIGDLHIANARDIAGSELMNAIETRGFNLNTGIVAQFEGELYHGKDALHLLAILGSEQGWMNRLNVTLMRHKAVVTLLYPFMVGVRNLALRALGAAPVMSDPIFAPVFADQWIALPPVMRAHYANRPRSHDRVTVEGTLTVRMAPVMKPFAPILSMLGMLTPWTGEDVPCTVHFLSEPDGDGFIFDRHFRFTGRKLCRFRSKLVARGAHDAIEYMTCGIGWRCGYSFDEGRVVLSHKGYVWRLFGMDVPLPGAELIIGRGEAYETPEDDTHFSMFMGLRHWLFGWLYRYEGRFKLTEMALGSVLVLGGYGNFGKRICHALNRHGVPVIVAGRDMAKAEALAAQLPAARAVAFDIHHDLDACLAREKPSVVVHTCGPFQGADYSVARACIAAGAHYVDLSDARDFVSGISTLDAEAKAAGVTVISGASTVPGLSSAVIAHFLPQFARLDAVDFGISPGQKAERGLATTRAILSYAGRSLHPFAGHERAYGWQDNRSVIYPGLGRRWFANCDIPDLDLLPQAYGLKSVRFGAGLELPPLHFGLWALSWLVRSGVPLDLEKIAGPLLAASNLFNIFGSDAGGMHMVLSGTGHDSKPLVKRWFIIAGSGDGPQIPCVPAVLLARRLHEGWRLHEKGSGMATGAFPCVGLVSLEDYLKELQPFDIATF